MNGGQLEVSQNVRNYKVVLTPNNLTWTAAGNAKSYRVFRGAATGGPYTQIGTASGTAYTDNGPQLPTFTWATTYYYVVTAVAGGWTSASSNEASLKTPKSANCN